MVFKMKGRPMQRNFGIGSPVKQAEEQLLREKATQAGIETQYKQMGLDDTRRERLKSSVMPGGSLSALGFKSPVKQSNKDLKDYLIDEKGFNQSDADKMIEDGAYTVSDKGFLSWYKTKDKPAPDVDTPAKIYKKKKGSHSKY